MFDERFILHRYKSTSFAGVACALMVWGLWSWHWFRDHEFRKDLFVILCVTATIKIACLAWYRLRD